MSVVFASSSCRCSSSAARGQQLPPWTQKTGPLHEDPAEGAGEGVCSQQVHHQRQEKAHLRRHQPLRASSHHLVPEPAGEGEEIRQ